MKPSKATAVPFEVREECAVRSRCRRLRSGYVFERPRACFRLQAVERGPRYGASDYIINLLSLDRCRVRPHDMPRPW